MKNKVKSQFKVGDIIRRVPPYWGEPAYRLVDEDKYGFFGIWSGSADGYDAFLQREEQCCITHK